MLENNLTSNAGDASSNPNLLKVKYAISVPLAPPKGIAKIMIISKQVPKHSLICRHKQKGMIKPSQSVFHIKHVNLLITYCIIVSVTLTKKLKRSSVWGPLM